MTTQHPAQATEATEEQMQRPSKTSLTDATAAMVLSLDALRVTLLEQYIMPDKFWNTENAPAFDIPKMMDFIISIYPTMFHRLRALRYTTVRPGDPEIEALSSETKGGTDLWR